MGSGNYNNLATTIFMQVSLIMIMFHQLHVLGVQSQMMTTASLVSYADKCTKNAKSLTRACSSAVTKARNGSLPAANLSSNSRCCKQLRLSTPDCRCLLLRPESVFKNNETLKFLHTNEEMAKACDVKLSTDCSAVDAILERQRQRTNITNNFLTTCEQEAQLIKDKTCASTVDKAKNGSTLTKGIEFVECCGTLKDLARDFGCLCSIKERNNKKLSNETLDFFQYVRTNNQFKDSCGKFMDDVDCDLHKRTIDRATKSSPSAKRATQRFLMHTTTIDD